MSDLAKDQSIPQTLLEPLKIPREYSRYDITETETIARLETWKRNAESCLESLKDLVTREDHQQLCVQNQAEIVTAVAAFDGPGLWVSESSQKSAADILEPFSAPDVHLLERIYSHHIKPIFQSSPHPYLNETTGRKLPRPAGGPMASQDYYEDRNWKGYPAIANVVLWCIIHTQSEVYERQWHLVIPPVMALVDDYQAVYKVQGVRLANAMLLGVPKELLKRTGVDGLLLTSLMGCLNHLRNPETPELLRAAIPTIISLIKLTTTPGSQQRFDLLCALLGDGIIGSVWRYAYADADTIVASVDALPELVNILGIGCTRYLKALVPQLVHPLVPIPFKDPSTSLQLSSLSALGLIIEVCAPRMSAWKFTIFDGVDKCWASLDSGAHDERSLEIKSGLKGICEKLARACPEVLEDDYSPMVARHLSLFKGFVQITVPDTAA